MYVVIIMTYHSGDNDNVDMISLILLQTMIV